MSRMPILERIKKPLLGAVLLFGALACGNEPLGGPSKPKASPSDSASGELALTVLVAPKDNPKASRVVKIGPADSGTSSEQDSSAAESALDPLGPLLATVQRGDEEPRQATGWTLLSWALESCMPPRTDMVAARFPFFIVPTPWSSSTTTGNLREFYMFRRISSEGPLTPYQTCDDALLLQEVLLCGADRLAQIGDSVGTVTWDTADPDGNGNSVDITVTIPPQQTEDKFIARDLALNALAHIALLESKDRTYPAGNSGPNDDIVFSCADGYAQPGHATWLFPFPTSPLISPGFRTFDSGVIDWSQRTTEERQVAGEKRLGRYVNLLAASGRLVKDLVERSVRDDISGAQQKMAGAADLSRAARQAWGVEENQSPYNSLRHALRVLFGRLELGNEVGPLGGSQAEEFVWVAHDRMRDDPQCFNQEGIGIQRNDQRTQRALDLLLGMAGGTDARWNDLRPTTAGESLAMSVFDRSGIVLPPEVNATPDQIRTAVKDHLLRQGAARAEKPFDQAYRDTVQGQAIGGVIDGLSDAEIRFGLDRVYDAFRLLADFDGLRPGPSSSWQETLLAAADAALIRTEFPGAAPDIEAVDGIVVLGGLNRDDLAIDVMARMRPLQIASQCGLFPFANTNPNSDHPTRLDYALGAKSGSVTAFQNVFHLGEAFRRRLASIARSVEQDSPVTRAFADAAAAEIRQWAASSTILREGETAQQGADRWYVLNLFPEDYGASSEQEFLSRLVIVHSPNPAHAECRAGVRKSCAFSPPTFRLPFSTAPFGTSPPAGLDKTPTRFLVDRGLSESASYLVLEPRDGKPGQVLAALNKPMQTGTLPSQFDYFTEVISPLQRKLANEVFGIGQNESTERSCTNIAPIALPREYCIKGMERDQFVPLANELTSAGTGMEDSWRHYLQLAEEAALKTDELGRQMIELGITRDLRQEAAAEAVGELCGAYPNDVGNVNASAGQIDGGEVDEAVNACIQPELVDLVFLRDDPLMNVRADCGPPPNVCPEVINEYERSKRICEVFCPQSNGGSGLDRFPFCKEKCPVAADPAQAKLITHAGLDFITGSLDVEGDLSACTNLQQAFPPDANPPDLQLDTAKFAAAAEASFSSQAGVATAVNMLNLIERPNRDWMLTLSERPLIGTIRIVTESMFGMEKAIGALTDPEKAQLADVYPICLELNNCSELGELLQGAFPDPDPLSDPYYSQLREEVERAYFYLGALAGNIPAGHITIPMPIGNRTALTDDAAVGVPAPAVYGPDRFVPAGPAGEYQIGIVGGLGQPDGYIGNDQWSPADTHLLQDPENPRPFPDEEYFDDRLPTAHAWRAAIYERARAAAVSGNAGYLYLNTSNAQIRFNPSLIQVGERADAENFTREFLQDWLKTDVVQNYRDPSDDVLAGILDQAAYYNEASYESEFCSPKRGRYVCTEAAVSPVFYTSRHATGCAALRSVDAPLELQDGLAVLHTARTRLHVDQFGDSASVFRMGVFTLRDVVRESREPWDRENPDEIDCDPNCVFPLQYFDPRKNKFVWSSNRPTGCSTGTSWEVFSNTLGTGRSCAQYKWRNRFWGSEPDNFDTHRIAHDRLKPSECSPGARLELFLAKDLANSAHAMKTIVRALSLSCVARTQPTIVNGLPPPLEDEGDLRYLEAWAKQLANVTTASASVVALTEIPRAVVDHVKARELGTGFVAQGDRGQSMLELEESLRGIESSIGNLGTTFHLINTKIKDARLLIQSARDEDKARRLQLALQRLENQRTMAIAEARKTAAKIAGVAGIGGVLSDPPKAGRDWGPRHQPCGHWWRHCSGSPCGGGIHSFCRFPERRCGCRGVRGRRREQHYHRLWGGD